MYNELISLLEREIRVNTYSKELLPFWLDNLEKSKNFDATKKDIVLKVNELYLKQKKSKHTEFLGLLGLISLLNKITNYDSYTLKGLSFLGFYLSDHPMNDLRRHLQFKGGTLMENKGKQGLVTLLGTLTHIKQHRTKKGDLMAFAVLSDDTAQMDVVIMPQLYKQTAEHLTKGRNVIIHGKMDKETSCLANQIQFIDTK